MVDLKRNPFFLNDEQIAWVGKTRDSMSTERKLGQMMAVNIRDFSDTALREVLDVFEPGAVMYRPGDPAEELAYSKKLKGACKVPPLVAANLEAGGNGIVKGGTLVGAPMAVAATDDDRYASALARVCAVEGGAVGANWAFAPIIDIDYNWRNPVTNTRTFGSDPDRVARMGKAYVEELQSHSFAACIKHFPGDGKDDRDQHILTGVNDSTYDEWFDTYGRVYKTCIEAGALTCMVGHIKLPYVVKELYPDIRDEDILPGSQSYEVITGILRERLGFNGLVSTDSTVMGGYMIPQARWKALPASIMAGADIILFNKNMQEDYEFLREALADGTLTMERIDEAVTRILAVKAALGMNEPASEAASDEAQELKLIGCEEHKSFAREIADKSITLVKEQKGVLPLSPEKYKKVMFYPVEDPAGTGDHGARKGASLMVADMLHREGFDIDIFTGSDAEEGNSPRQREEAEKYDLIVYVGNLASKCNTNGLHIEWSEPMWADCPSMPSIVPTIFIAIDYPYLLPDVPSMQTYIVTYSSADSVLDAVVDKLMGRSGFVGKAPSDFFCGKWDTRL